MIVDLEKHERLKYELRISGSSLAKISRELGLTQTSVSTVCQGYRRSYRIETAIAKQLDKLPEQIWPERYKEKEVAE